MIIPIELLLRRLRVIYLKKHPKTYSLARELDPQKSSDIIYNLLCSPNPCMIARYGMVEYSCLMNYLGVQSKKIDYLGFIKGKALPWWWMEKTRFQMMNNAGFFPNKNKYLKQYSELLLSDTKYVDVLASWIDDEVVLEKQLEHTQKIALQCLEPFWVEFPWTRALEGKKVLVVHPFASLIEKQYKYNRKRLFKNPLILPDFSLSTIQAVQSMGGVDNGFKTWFDALKWMEDEIDKQDYDICIIGCGAYGFNLAAYVKRSGKKAIHMGGVTQLLFGIKGKRWENVNYGVNEWKVPYGAYSKLLNNKYWIRPTEENCPKNFKKVEHGCYW